MSLLADHKNIFFFPMLTPPRNPHAGPADAIEAAASFAALDDIRSELMHTARSMQDSLASIEDETKKGPRSHKTRNIPTRHDESKISFGFWFFSRRRVADRRGGRLDEISVYRGKEPPSRSIIHAHHHYRHPRVYSVDAIPEATIAKEKT